MIKFFLLIISITLFAQNPKIYATLGDTIYDNVSNISNLKNITSFSKHSEKIDTFISDANTLKKMGNSIISKDMKKEKSEYLKHLRVLSKTNDFFIREVKNSFKESIENENSILFLDIVNSKLLDTESYKEEIIDYYLSHSNDIDSSGTIQNLLDENAKLTKKRDKKIKKQFSKKQKQDEKIQRIRAKDLAEYETLKKQLEEDVARKKAEIIKEQKRELGN